MTDKRYLILDIETDGLNPTVIWVCVTKDIQSGEVRTWLGPKGLSDYLDGFILVGHNVLWFDLPVLNRLWKLGLNPESCLDTLVVSRLINSWDYSRHSLSEWGSRLGLEKFDFNDWSKLTDEMIEYCIRDVEVNERVFDFLRKFIDDERLRAAILLEHRAAIICTEMHYNGFGFDIVKCETLYSRIRDELSGLDGAIQEAFPPRQVVNRTIYPKPTKSGAISRVDFRWLTDGRTPEELGAKVGVPFYTYEEVVFNPASPKQCIEKLNELGWAPTEKTKGHINAERDLRFARGADRVALLEKLEQYKLTGWTISEENLATLPPDAPQAAHLLTRHILLTRRLTTLDEWKLAYNERTLSIHGEVRPIGTWTHRAAHKNPNTGNIARTSSEFGYEMRSLWGARKGWRQIGCDAEGIQLRILAHYMDDDEFTRALVSGNSDDGTDVHTLNWKKLNGNSPTDPCKDRTTAKTFIYSYLLGAAAAKTANVFGCTLEEAKRARERFVNAFPGLKFIREEMIPEDAERGYFWGLDGRPVMCDSEHLMLAGYLQNGETIVMKHANWLWREKLKAERIPFRQMAYVHDEWQTETVDDDDVVKFVKEVQANSIVQAGIDLGVKCPLAGKAVDGYNWADCH
jgi:DNA polymerase-1